MGVSTDELLELCPVCEAEDVDCNWCEGGCGLVPHDCEH